MPSARNLDRPTLDDHIPQLLEEIAEALKERRDESIPAVMLEGTPPAHGIQRLEDGFDLEEVVAEYNILRGAIHDLAEEHGIDIRGTTFHILNRVLDTAIGLAVQTYATQRAFEVKQRREEYLAFVAHDLRTPLSAVSLSASLLELSLEGQLADPQIALAFSTLKRNVKQIEELVSMVLKENTVEAGDSTEKLVRRRFDLWPHVESVFRNLAPVAATNSTELVNEVPAELAVFADAGMLTRILQNLVSNAIRYSPRGQVTVGARRSTMTARATVGRRLDRMLGDGQRCRHPQRAPGKGVRQIRDRPQPRERHRAGSGNRQGLRRRPRRRSERAERRGQRHHVSLHAAGEGEVGRFSGGHIEADYIGRLSAAATGRSKLPPEISRDVPLESSRKLKLPRADERGDKQAGNCHDDRGDQQIDRAHAKHRGERKFHVRPSFWRVPRCPLASAKKTANIKRSMGARGASTKKPAPGEVMELYPQMHELASKTILRSLDLRHLGALAARESMRAVTKSRTRPAKPNRSERCAASGCRPPRGDLAEAANRPAPATWSQRNRPASSLVFPQLFAANAAKRKWPR